MVQGINKSGNFLEKDFPSPMSFTSSERIQAIIEKSDLLMPPGTILAWMEGYFTAGNNTGYTSTQSINYTNIKKNKTLNTFYVLADGQVCMEPLSLFYNQIIPKINDDRFLMGSLSFGVVGGNNNLIDHKHETVGFTATLTMNSLYCFSHYHAASNLNHTQGSLNSHMVYTYKEDTGQPPGSWKFISDDSFDSGTGGDVGIGGSHYHSNITTSTTGTFVEVITPHSHSVSAIVDPTLPPGTPGIGTGVYPSQTDHKPKYLSCLYIYKVL